MDNNITNQKKEDNRNLGTSLSLLSDVLSLTDIDIEMLNKIRFFVTNSKMNPYLFQVDVKKSIFYNMETNETFEVIKKQDTNNYEIIKHNNVYENTIGTTQNMYSEQLRTTTPKIMTRKIEKKPYINNAAFTKISFLIINIINFVLLTTMLLLLKK